MSNKEFLELFNKEMEAVQHKGKFGFEYTIDPEDNMVIFTDFYGPKDIDWPIPLGIQLWRYTFKICSPVKRLEVYKSVHRKEVSIWHPKFEQHPNSFVVITVNGRYTYDEFLKISKAVKDANKRFIKEVKNKIKQEVNFNKKKQKKLYKHKEDTIKPLKTTVLFDKFGNKSVKDSTEQKG